MRTDRYDLGNLMQVAFNAVNLLFLGYLMVYASACPTPPLITAVAFEIAFYIFVLGYRVWKSKHRKSAEHLQLEALHDEWKLLGRLRKTYRLTAVALAGMLFVYLSIDLTALLLAKSGRLDLACATYRVISLPSSPAIHPGFSMELLAGGYIESKQFGEAEPIFLSIEKLRKSLVGKHDELIADIYANLGDLYAKDDQNDKAERYYEQSIALAKQLRLRQGYGSPMTKLGSLYAKERRFDDAERAYDDALSIRTKLFGVKSDKVAETLAAKVELLKLRGKTLEANLLEKQIVSLPASTSYVETTVLPVSISAASVVIFWKRDRIVLLGANLIKNFRPR